MDEFIFRTSANVICVYVICVYVCVGVCVHIEMCIFQKRRIASRTKMKNRFEIVRRQARK